MFVHHAKSPSSTSSAFRSSFRHSYLLAGASAIALMVASPSTARDLRGSQAVSPVTNVTAQQLVGMQAAQAAALRSSATMMRATQAIQAMQAAQQAARNAAAGAPGNVPNGLTPGGLVVAAGATPGSALWQGANGPVQSQNGGQTRVDIRQTQSRAILTWESFNVGRDTTVNFDQSSGNNPNGTNNWVALNRVTDPSGRPSEIMGKIKAEGQVYIINRNGIIFGGASQINVGSLVATSLPVTDNLTGVTQGFAVGGELTFSSVAEALQAAPGKIDIQAGANIATGRGTTIIAAPTVTNAGTVVSQDGQVVLAGTLGVSFIPYELNSALAFNGFDRAVPAGLAVVGGNPILAASLSRGTVINTGFVGASRGNVSLTAFDVRQQGVVQATTAVNRFGSILIAAHDPTTRAVGDGSNAASGGILTIGSSALTLILPERDGATAASNAAANAAFVRPAAIISGAQVTLENNTLIYAPGANLDLVGLSVNLAAPAGLVSRIDIGRGATVDVSGLADVRLSMSANLINIPRVGMNELADSPLQRDGFLFRSSVTVDARQSGVRADGLEWFGSPLLNLGGYVENQPRAIDQLLTDGGKINIVGQELVARAGSLLNVDGGFVRYLAGMLQTSRLVGADGRLYSVAGADPNILYIGFAGQTTVNHARWGVIETFTNSILGGARFEPEYVSGGKAGSINLVLSNLALMGGEVSGKAVSGRFQVASGKPAEGGTFNLFIDPDLARKAFSGASGAPLGRAITVVAGDVVVSDDFGFEDARTTLPGGGLSTADPLNPVVGDRISAGMINRGEFSHVRLGDVRNFATVEKGASLKVQDGGDITISSARAEIYGDLTARAGRIAVTASGIFDFGRAPIDPATGFVSRGDIFVGEGVKIDASGRFVNDAQSSRGGELTGSAFINGGSISFSTAQAQARAAQGGDQPLDNSGSIVLKPGAILDVSGGGYVRPDGRVAISGGIPSGKGGSISLRSNGGSSLTNPFAFAAQFPVVDATVGRIIMDGAQLRGFSMAGGGTLSLGAVGIRIGGERPADLRILYLEPDFFASQGFGSYQLSAGLDAIIAADTTVRVSQRNLIPDIATIVRAPTGADIYSGAFGRIGSLDAFRRPATNFTLTGNTVLVDRGASLQLDAGAQVRLFAPTPGLGVNGQTNLVPPNRVTVLGSIVAHGGRISLATESDDTGAVPTGAFFSRSRSVWLGAESLLDVSGISLIDPLASPVFTPNGRVAPRIGKILNGGTVSLTSATAYVVVKEGARIDISGAADQYDLPTSIGSRSLQPGGRSRQDVWSNAGTLTLTTGGGLFFDGSISAHGGSAEAQGGTLTLRPVDVGFDSAGLPILIPPGTGGIIFTQSGNFIPAGLMPGQAIESGALTSPSGIMRFAADRLNGSGIDTLIAGSAPNFGRIPLRIGFAGDVTLAVGSSIQFNASSYTALAAGATSLTPSGAGGTVNLIAPYVSLQGNGGDQQALATGLVAPDGGVLNVQAAHIDIGGRFKLNNFTNATFESTGDIRFFTPAQFAGDRVGQLLTAGDLTFKAAQLYPSSSNRFAIVALGPLVNSVRRDTTITILQNGSAATPLSASGTLLFDATRINQFGTIRAPSGSIVLGVTDPNDAATRTAFGNLTLVGTQSVRLGAGSLTSVSLDGLLIPFGMTRDLLDYLDTSNPNLTNPVPLTAPPEKRIAVNGTNVALDNGATVDLSGGGDLYASEFVPGTGGTRDLLSRTNTRFVANQETQVPLFADGRSVYAIVPGFKGSVAPYDPTLDKGDVRVGQSIYLSGGNGIPAGFYTLLPAKYATLPGAFRVVQDTGAIDTIASQNATFADGTQRIAGYFADNFTGSRDGRGTSFLVQSREVWGAYSEYAITSASQFFAAKAASGGTAVPRLPIDAGRLSISATADLTFGATLRTGAAAGGVGAEVDIASAQIQIVGETSVALGGYLQLAASDLNALGAASLLIGGTRTQNGNGVTIAAQASNVVVSNDENSALVGSEILLVSNGNAIGGGTAGVRLDDGSVIRATGDLPAISSRNITIGRNADAANGITGISGDGALLRVSNGAPVLVLRNNVSGDPSRGVLDIRAGALIDGGISLSLDATGDTRLDPRATIIAKAIDANSSLVTFVSDAASGAGLTGLVIGPDTLAQLASAESVTFRSRTAMNFLGIIDVTLGNAALTLSAGSFVGNGGDVSLRAKTLTLSNDLGAAAPAAGNAGGRLTLAAERLQFGAGDKSIAGFSRVDASATEAIVGVGRGKVDFGAAPVTLTVPAIVAGAAGDTTLTTTGVLRLARSQGDGPADLPIGGALTLVGGTIDSDARIVARSGTLTLRVTSGDLVLRDGGIIDVTGVAKQFFDITAYAPAGAINLVANTGDVRVLQGAVLDFAGTADGGDAGSLNVVAAQGIAAIDGTIRGNATAGFEGGAFRLDTGGAVVLDTLSERLAAIGLERSISIRSRVGNLELTAGHVLRAREVMLIADGGTGGSASTEGKVIIGGTVDASGEKGGTIDLAGKSGVNVQGSLIATGSRSDERGGTVKLSTVGNTDGSYNSSYGFQNVTAAGSGSITIGANAVIDVSGGSAGGLSGGSLSIRAPLLNDGDVNVTVANAGTIRGAREVGLEAYATWSTTDTTTGAQHFDGIIDPAGFFTSAGARVAGTWTDAAGNTVTGTIDEARHFFAPTTPNADHTGFYQTTLANFVQNPNFTFTGRFNSITNFKARVGIELKNPSPAINGGNISVLTPWNLGAGATATNLTYRTNGEAPVLTLKADRNVDLKASITDGFYNAYGDALNPSDAVTAADATDAFNASSLFLFTAGRNLRVFRTVPLPAGTPDQQSLYYEMYVAYANLFASDPDNAFYGVSGVASLAFAFMAANSANPTIGGFSTAPNPANPAPALPAALEDYAAYLAAYRTYAEIQLSTWLGLPNRKIPHLEAPKPPPAQLTAGAPPIARNGNLSAPIAFAQDQIPIHSAGLIGGGSSYRFMAGANFDSSGLLAVDVNRTGDVTLQGYSIYTTTTTPRDIRLPTLLRTGTGSIDLAASNDIRLDDDLAPGALYTAGRPVAGGAASTPTVVGGNVLQTSQINPEAAGDVRLVAGRDIVGNRKVFDVDGRVTGTVGAFIGQYWTDWMQRGNLLTASSINFGGFGQGIMSVGGNVDISAGRDVRELSVSLPTTYRIASGTQQVTIFGGGDLSVTAGRDVLSGDYFVSKGSGVLKAAGLIGSGSISAALPSRHTSRCRTRTGRSPAGSASRSARS